MSTSSTSQTQVGTWLSQAAKFGLFGAFGTALNFAVYLGGEAAGLHYVAASFLGWFCGLTLVFTLNRRFTFGDDQPLLRSFLRTLAVYLTQQIIFAAGLVICRETFQLGPIVSFAINLPIAIAISFLGLKFYAMRRKT